MLSYDFGNRGVDRQFCRRRILAASAAALILIARPAPAATTWYVSSAADDNGATTLRSIVAAAIGGDTINFTASLGGSTITLTGGELAINKSLIINGLGPSQLAIVNLSGRVFHVQNGPISVAISGFRLTGQVTGAKGADGTFFAHDGQKGEDVRGGCILNEVQCTLTVSNCLFTDCMAVGGNGGNGYTNDNYGFLSNGGPGGEACGGAICNNLGDALIYCCSFSSNSASGGMGGNGYYRGAGGFGGAGEGGAMCDVYGNQDVLIVNCTFYTNAAAGGFGGNGGDAWINQIGPANGGTGGGGGNANGGAIFIGQGCPDATCTGLVHDTIDQNVVLPGWGKPGGAGINGGMQGGFGANGTANGGGLYFQNAGHLPIQDTIIAGDFVIFRFTTGIFIYNGPDVSGNLDSFRYNLIGVADGSGGWVAGFDFLGSTVVPIDPLLGPYQNNGGETLTMAPLACSPVIDKGGATILNYDQIYQHRPVGITTPPYFGVVGSDIGAYELQAYPASAPVPLTIAQINNGVVISWPSSSCFVLQQTGDLGKPNWVNSMYPVNVSGALKQVTISPAPGNLFFRLWHP